MSNSCHYDCSSHPSGIEPYGDVAGIGVTVAFISTAWIVVFLLIIYYLAVFNPELDPFRKKNANTPTQYPNHIDFSVLRLVRLLPNRRFNLHHASRLEPALNKCVITLSDIQIFTGISVLVSGCIALHCGISAYHWQLIVYLAWLANVTHLATLSFLRNHFANRPMKLGWRVGLMFAVLGMLCFAVGLTAYFEWENGPQTPADHAVCYLGNPLDTKTITFESMVKMIFLLAYGFSIRVAKMFRGFETSLRQISAIMRATSTKRQRGGSQSISELDPRGRERWPRLISTVMKIVSPPCLHRGSRRIPEWDPRAGEGWRERMAILIYDPFVIAGFSLINIHLDLFTSFLAEVYWVIFALIWGTKRLFYTRNLGPSEENEWSFGQTLPLVLLLAPVAAIFENFPWRSKPSGREVISQSGINDGSPDHLELEDNRVTDMNNIDREYVDSISYLGAFCLAAFSYIQAGIFFVVDDLRGISQPFRSFAFSFFVFNPILQLCWILCSLWFSRMHWIIPLKRSANAVALLSLAIISMTEFWGSPDDDPEIDIAGRALTNLLVTYTAMIIIFAANHWIGESFWKIPKLVLAFLPLVLLPLAVIDVARDEAWKFAWPCLLAFSLSIFWFVVECCMNEIRLAGAMLIRSLMSCAVLVSILLMFYISSLRVGNLLPSVWEFSSWIIIMWSGLVSLALLLSVFEDGDNGELARMWLLTLFCRGRIS
ncbi:uncharacterized protein FMAN_09699 [Fusarium mangiferae]|uniref:Uncharacterized protein n=1 Tax=Fusarium mangiferae TaxID=192010 RepID=A0A1L7UFI2_FUSMA|nr:uncharacterized protein FMAN_09699 [Fusarium mangiferae]CVL07952.1 uncharacterized protein FMAN_09699 [Fusarium mangiferae]